MTTAEAPTAHWSYLYTFYLAGVYAIFGAHPLAARMIQAVIVGVLHPILAYWLGKKTFGPLVGLIAAALTALYTYFIYYSAILMTEAFYITAILGCLSLAIAWVEWQTSHIDAPWNRRSVLLACGLGVSLGVTVLLRQVYLLFLPFLFGWMWWATGHRFSFRRISSLALPGVILVLMILPFTLYNYTRFERFVLLNTNAGFAFYWANHPIYGRHFEPILPEEMGSYGQLIPKELRELDEAALDSKLLGQGIAFILEDPGRYLLLSLSRIPAYFMFWPSASSGLISNISRVAGFGLLLPFMLFGLVKAFLMQPKSARPVWASAYTSAQALLLNFFVVYSLVHILTWSLIRYRLPVDAILMIFAGLAVFELFQWVAGWIKLPFS